MDGHSCGRFLIAEYCLFGSLLVIWTMRYAVTMFSMVLREGPFVSFNDTEATQGSASTGKETEYNF